MKNIVRKELLFSGGTGASSYILGFSEGLIKIFGKEKLKEYTYGGISAGFVNAFLLYCSLNSSLNLKDLYNDTLRDLYKEENKYKNLSIFVKPNSVDEILKKCWIYYKQLNLPSTEGKVYTFVSEFENNKKMSPLLIDRFEDEINFIEGIKATTQLPFITVNSLTAFYKGKKVLKGSLTRPIPYKFDDSYKIFINVRPEYFIRNVKDVKNLHVIDIKNVQKLIYPLHYWFWNVEWADSMFDKGYDSAFLLEKELRKNFI
jgi:hypothetical protein